MGHTQAERSGNLNHGRVPASPSRGDTEVGATKAGIVTDTLPNLCHRVLMLHRRTTGASLVTFSTAP
jgi:hypothetical protein